MSESHSTYGHFGGFGRFLVAIVRPIARLLFPLKVEGIENLPADERPLIVCCNHISMLDPVFLVIGQRQQHIYFMSKEELFGNPFCAWLFGKQIGAFPVSRGKGDTDALARAVELINERRWLGIFPEGTRSKTGELGRFKSGAAFLAAATQAYVLPASLTTKDQKVRLFRRVTLRFGEPISPAAMQIDSEKPNLRVATRAMVGAVTELMEADQ